MYKVAESEGRLLRINSKQNGTFTTPTPEARQAAPCTPSWKTAECNAIARAFRLRSMWHAGFHKKRGSL